MQLLYEHLTVLIIFHETGAEIWYFVQMWLATLEGSMLCGNDRTGDQSQAGMFRYYCIAFFLPKTDSANSSRIVLPKSFPLKICPPNFFHQNSSTKFTKTISLVTNSHSFLSLVIYRIYFSKSFPQRDSVLYIRGATFDDAGYYICEGVDTRGTTVFQVPALN